ncbi:pyridoxamine kinase [Carnobacterium maltaromaticum]|uniref:pyridoxamine kinase n=1 Tax=Carnobacterium maltaromaticum TaxID=2751 RepID=UPI001D5FC0CB|nr:pyridoxamine kinase [Carnobacterium maltaromaticum]MCC4312272.1 pyridoxal kinase [Carnobacterium maltaromaticum]
MQKKVLVVHDLSGVGKVALTVTLPILATLGIESCVLPTALLSTHTGGLGANTYLDLTEEMKKIIAHWKSLDLKFDAIYTGYLGNPKQIDLVIDTIDTMTASQCPVIIDPVMADSGKLYRGFQPGYPAKMRKLCEKATVIIPNLTEAALLLEEPFQTGPYTKDYIEDLLKRLGQLGPKKIILTGVYFDEFEIGAASFDVETNRINYALDKKMIGHYFGTGDIFASIVTGSVLSGKDIHAASEIAVRFIHDAISKTLQQKQDPKFGVCFETELPKLLKIIN